MTLDAIRAREGAATPGPWYSGDGSVDRFFAGKNTVATQARVIVERATYNDEFDQQTYSDIEFIAHARTDIPDMLAEIDRLTAALADMTAERDKWHKAYEVKKTLIEVMGAASEIAQSADEAEITTLKADRDAWQKRAEAAEQDLKDLVKYGNVCHSCKHFVTGYQSVDEGSQMQVDDCRIEDCEDGEKWEWAGIPESEWRGPDAENRPKGGHTPDEAPRL